MAQHRGGAQLGRGVHGYALDVQARPHDPVTLAAELAEALAAAPPSAARPWQVWVVDARGGLERRAVRTGAEGARLVRALTGVPGARHTIAKRLIDATSRSADAAFALELGATGRVLRAYGTRAAIGRFTTLLPALRLGGAPVAALRLPAAPARCYVLGERGLRDLERHRFTPAQVLDMADDIMTGLDRLHAGGMLHADLKLDNMVICRPQAPGQRHRFKLIDWGGAMRVADLRRKYLVAGASMHGCAPAAAFALGLGPVLPAAHMLLHAHYYRRETLTSPGFVAFCLGSLRAFQAKLAALRAARPGLGDRALRAEVLRRFPFSIDRHNLGVALAALVYGGARRVSPPLQGAGRERALRLARQLTLQEE